MSAEIDFFFDFSSSYSYVAVPDLVRLAAKVDAKINWKPFLLGVIFKAQGHAPPERDNAKSRYMNHDLKRRAASAGLPEFVMPATFPFNAISAMRAFWHLHETDPGKAVEWARAVFTASFAEARDCSNPKTLAQIAKDLGLDDTRLLSATAEQSVKETLKKVTSEAMERGVFGAPTFFIGDEMFWGGDRLPDIERYLSGA